MFGIPWLTQTRAMIIGGVLGLVVIGGIAVALTGEERPAPVEPIVPAPTPPAPEPDPPAPQPQPQPAPYNPPQPYTPPQGQQNPPPDPSNYSMLSGFWIDDFANYMQVSVSSNGYTSGQVTSGPLAGYGLLGQFTGTVFQYGVGNAYGQGAQSMGEWADACHIQYLLVDAFGQPTGQTSVIHVNHYPNDPCPPGMQ